MSPQSRKKRTVSPDTKIPEGSYYCRVCQRLRSKNYFYETTNPEVDTCGYMSVCKECLNTLYVKYYNIYHNVDAAVLKICQLFDIKFDQSAIAAALKHYENNGTESDKFIGMYKTKLLLMNRHRTTDRIEDIDLRYNHPVSITIAAPPQAEVGSEDLKELRAFWGEGFNINDLQILEKKFSDWSKSHSIDTQSERVLLKFICLKEYEIDKAISSKSGTATLMKEFQELLKTSALSPSMASASSGNKSMEAFGVWVKEIESVTPAEWIKDKSIYRDVDNIEEYGDKYITSPLRAFITGSKEFSLEDDSEKDDDTEFGMEE